MSSKKSIKLIRSEYEEKLKELEARLTELKSYKKTRKRISLSKNI